MTFITYVIKIGEFYLDLNNGEIKLVDNIEKATHFKKAFDIEQKVIQVRNYNVKNDLNDIAKLMNGEVTKITKTYKEESFKGLRL